MRGQDEIVQAIRAMIALDRPMEGEFGVLLPCLDYAHARPFIDPSADAATWEAAELTLTEEQVVADATACLRGIWEVVDDHNHRKAERRLGNVRAYVWLFGTDAQAAEFDAVPEQPFGAPRFAYAAHQFGLPAPESEPAIRMSQGRPCSDLCVICFGGLR